MAVALFFWTCTMVLDSFSLDNTMHIWLWCLLFTLLFFSIKYDRFFHNDTMYFCHGAYCGCFPRKTIVFGHVPCFYSVFFHILYHNGTMVLHLILMIQFLFWSCFLLCLFSNRYYSFCSCIMVLQWFFTWYHSLWTYTMVLLCFPHHFWTWYHCFTLDFNDNTIPFLIMLLTVLVLKSIP